MEEYGRLIHIIWRDSNHLSLESCRVTGGGTTIITGEVVGNLQGIWGTLTYEVHCRPDGSTHWVRGRVCHEQGEMFWAMNREEDGRWRVNGELAPSLAACQDVDISVTPSTNTLVIRRLGLKVGVSQDLSAALLRFPDLTVHVLPQRYTRLSTDVYRYESLASGFQAMLQVDEYGIVQKYDDLWESLSVFER